MALPNLSNSMYVARLRYIQSIREPAERRNPDTLIRHFIPFVTRLRTAWLRQSHLSRLRSDPFYYYLVARTRYYDQVLSDAILDGAQRILIVGSGSDTRAYRFKDLMRSRDVSVLECDQAEAIQVKARLAKRCQGVDHVTYYPIDLNDEAWPDLERWLGDRIAPPTLVVIEGVSAYVNDRNFRDFLRLLAARLSLRSRVAYDFKIRGIKDDFGRGGRTERPFRLPDTRSEVATFHRTIGFHLEHMELSSELSARLVPDSEKSGVPPFSEDGLVQLAVRTEEGAS